MRALRNFDDAKIVLQELMQWKDQITTKGWDFSGKRLTGLQPGKTRGDAVTFEQLPSSTAAPALSTQQAAVDQFYTIVWSLDETVTDDEEIAPFIVGMGRAGVPVQMMLIADTRPSGSPLAVNIELRTRDGVGGGLTNTNLLDDPLEFAPADDRAVVTSSFLLTGVPRLSLLSELRPIIVAANGAGLVTIQLVVKRIQ